LVVDDPERVDAHRAVLELDALAQPLADVALHRSADRGDVRLEDAVCRVLQPVREVAVVRQQEQALGVGVEASDVEEALLTVADVVLERDTAQLVVHRRDDTLGLVEGEVDAVLVEVDPHPVDVDHLGLWVDAHAELGDHLAVHLDAPLLDEVLADTPRPDTAGRHQLLQPHTLGVVDVDLGSGLAVGQLRGLARLRRAREARTGGLAAAPAPTARDRTTGAALRP
jgi:hypothetical protein